MNELQPLWDLLGAKYGWAAAIPGWIGLLRLVMKPFGAAVASFMAAAVEFSRNAGPGEVSWLDRVMHSWPYRLSAFLVDYLASVKLPLHAGDKPTTLPPVALVAVLAGAGLLVGCATLQQVATPERVRAVAALAGYTSCVNDTRGRPIERTKWVQVVGGLKVLVEAGQWDGMTVAQALERAGISEVVCEEGQVAISGGLAFLDMFTGVLQRAESAPIVRAVAEGMLDGIGRALDQSAGSRRNDLADLTAQARATRPKRRRDGRVKAAAPAGLLACAGCASVKSEIDRSKRS